MELDLQSLLTIIAGGMFGVVLGKFLDAAPDWVFWLTAMLLLLLTGYILSTGS